MLSIYTVFIFLTNLLRTVQLYFVPQRWSSFVGFQVRIFSIWQLWASILMLIFVNRKSEFQTTTHLAFYMMSGFFLLYYVTRWLQRRACVYFSFRSRKQLENQSIFSSYAFSLIVLGENIQDDHFRNMACMAIKIRLSHLENEESRSNDESIIQKCKEFLGLSSFF